MQLSNNFYDKAIHLAVHSGCIDMVKLLSSTPDVDVNIYLIKNFIFYKITN